MHVSKLIFLLLMLFSSLGADTTSVLKLIQEQGITVDLRNPEVTQESISATEGGVIHSDELRIQAESIILKLEDGNVILEASGNIFFERGPFLFRCDSCTYDFKTERGTLTAALVFNEPWIFGADYIYLFPGGNYTFRNGYFTTSESTPPDWRLEAATIGLCHNRFLKARSLTLKVGSLPVFWYPSIRFDLQSFEESPIRFRLRWGGEQGVRFGFWYDLFTWNNFTSTLRFDYRFNRGPGGGLETNWFRPDGTECWETINYFAHDSSVEDPSQHMRFRFQGRYHRELHDGKTTIDLHYDKLSDKYMATDYNDQNLKLKTGEKTELRMRHLETWGVTNLLARVKINSFQTIKQELPSLQSTLYPVMLSHQWIFDNKVQGSFLDFQYTSGLSNVASYQAGRFFWTPRLYRPFQMGPVLSTVSVEPLAIFYTDGPRGRDDSLLGMLMIEGESKIRLNKTLSCGRHVIEPYGHLFLSTAPSVSANDHFIFDLQDGLSHLNYLEVGVRQELYVKGGNSWRKNFCCNLYTYIFNPKASITIPIPKVYFDGTWYMTPTFYPSVCTAYDFEHRVLDHINVRLDWTINERIAFAAEYRHRSAYAWRKADPTNFFLDVFRTNEELLHSLLSDRRDTLLFHSFVWITPEWGLEYELRHGWLRKDQPNYTEYQVTVLAILRSLWQCKVSYQKREDDHRIAFYVSLRLDRPQKVCYSSCGF